MRCVLPLVKPAGTSPTRRTSGYLENIRADGMSKARHRQYTTRRNSAPQTDSSDLPLPGLRAGDFSWVETQTLDQVPKIQVCDPKAQIDQRLTVRRLFASPQLRASRQKLCGMMPPAESETPKAEGRSAAVRTKRESSRPQVASHGTSLPPRSPKKNSRSQTSIIHAWKKFFKQKRSGNTTRARASYKPNHNPNSDNPPAQPLNHTTPVESRRRADGDSFASKLGVHLSLAPI